MTICNTLNHALDKPTTSFSTFFESRPTAYKVTLYINHLFRAAMMVGFMFIPGMPSGASWGICLAGSLFYRLTVEKNCAYKFALPAFVGAACFMLALPALIKMINGSAFKTLAVGAFSTLSLIPFMLYLTYIGYTVNEDVNRTHKSLATDDSSCCCKD